MVTFIAIVFIAGYLLIATEEKTGINKSATALFTAALCWLIYIVGSPDSSREIVNSNLEHHLGGIAGIIFFYWVQ